MWQTLLCFSLLIVSSVADYDTHNKDLIDAIIDVGEAATKVMDYETQKDFYVVQKRIASVLRSTELTNEQLSSAIKLVNLISTRMEEGEISLHHIKRFIHFALSNRLKNLLSTWDTKLLKLH